MTYDKWHFINKFEAIPEDKWCTGTYEKDGRCCALGHCGSRWWDERKDTQVIPPESAALARLLSDSADINDGKNRRYPQPTPKQRVLAALRDLP